MLLKTQFQNAVTNFLARNRVECYDWVEQKDDRSLKMPFMNAARECYEDFLVKCGIGAFYHYYHGTETTISGPYYSRKSAEGPAWNARLYLLEQDVRHHISPPPEYERVAQLEPE